MIYNLEKPSPKVLITFVIAVICLPMCLPADTDFGWYFTEGGVGVDSYWGPATDIVIPDEINGYPVVEISYYPACWWDTHFKVTNREIINSVTIPDSVIRIPDPAPFWAHTNLGAILVSAGNSHFSSLDGVLFNKDKTSLIEFPSGRIGQYVIPDSVESIEAKSFTGCRLSNVSIPDSVTYIGDWAFLGCRFSNVTIPDSVTHIGNMAFIGCSFSSLTIPDSVSFIGWLAFNGCPLTSLYFMGEPPTMEKSMFYPDDTPSELVIYYPEGTPGWGSTFDSIPTAPFTPWGKYVPITSELGTHTNTNNWLGILEITHDPWIWCEQASCWFNIPVQTANAGEGWLYSPSLDTLQIMQLEGTDWGYSFTLEKWLYLTASSWVYAM